MNQPQQQQAHPAAVACEFMKRADMKGNEVEAYAQTYNWLQSILSGEYVVTPQKVHEDMMTQAQLYLEASSTLVLDDLPTLPVDPELEAVQ